jgi:ATP/maltotriose-dependent transcriptional regulator MalT
MISKNQQQAVTDAQSIPASDRELLLQSLISQVSSSVPLGVLQTCKSTVNEVILELNMNGMQYYLVRCRSKFQDSIHLSPRELAIARLIAQGFSNKHIGETLNISCWTVNTHLRRIFSKLGVTSRASMVARLMEVNEFWH